MRANGIAGITRRRRTSLTKPDVAAAMAPDLIRREFTAPTPGLRLIGDISCFPTSEGWLYLATVLDLCSKELIGYAIARHVRAGARRRGDHRGAPRWARRHRELDHPLRPATALFHTRLPDPG
jgi:transposase InsO family protein